MKREALFKNRAIGIEVRRRWKGTRHKRRWLDSLRDDIREEGLSGEEVYDRATWSHIYIEPTYKWDQWTKMTRSHF